MLQQIVIGNQFEGFILISHVYILFIYQNVS